MMRRLPRLLSLLSAASALVLGGTGCSDPVPPIPEGGWEVQFTNPGGGDCNVNSHNEKMGTVNATAKSELKQDGANVSVACSVSASSVSASGFEEVKNLDIEVGSITAEATKDNPATGSVSFASGTTAGTSYVSDADNPCNFYFLEGQGIQDGEVWLSFDCPAVTAEGQTCRIVQGFAAFRNCE